MRVAVVFLLLCEAFDVRSHLGHALLAVFRRGKTELLDKGAVEGARSIEADQRADLGNAERGVEQVSASLGHAQGIDVIIAAKPQSAAEQVGNIKLVEVEFFFQKETMVRKDSESPTGSFEIFIMGTSSAQRAKR